MRTIKFRAWEKERKEMVSDDHWSWFSDSFMPDIESNRHILMQYTGLRDQNGKEIFEGDIVKFANHGKRIGEIKWNDYYTGFQIVNIVNPYQGCLEQELHNGLDDCEVIGNIYEDKHLLGEKTS